MNRRYALRFAIGAAVGAERGANQRRVGVLAPTTDAGEEIDLEPFSAPTHPLAWVERTSHHLA